jgi:hypothetical protein
MKLLKLSLSDSAYEKALALSGGHALPVEAYISSEIEDLLDKKAKTPPKQAANDFNQEEGKFGPSPSTRSIVPSTLSQVLAVCTHVYITGYAPNEESLARAKFKDAVRAVAKELNIGESSVRDKCCTDRRLGLPDVPINTDVFVTWLCKPELLRDHLCRKFPLCINEIRKRFAELLPGTAASH